VSTSPEFPNAYAETLRAFASKYGLRNRIIEPVVTQHSHWDDWLPAEGMCEGRNLVVAHYAPNFDRKRRIARCYFCRKDVFHR
jgi:hypothetical protein